jgi:hypothetical protein
VFFGVLFPFSTLGVRLPIELDVLMGHLTVINTSHDSHIPLIFDLVGLLPQFNQGWVETNSVVILLRVITREFIVPAQPVLVDSLFRIGMRYLVYRDVVLVAKKLLGLLKLGIVDVILPLSEGLERPT